MNKVFLGKLKAVKYTCIRVPQRERVRIEQKRKKERKKERKVKKQYSKMFQI